MYKAIGIIPAAGRATRFGGLAKELLPAWDGRSLLSHACARLRPYCDLIIVVTSQKKVEHHMKEAKGVMFVEQAGSELLGAVQSGITIPAERYYFTMPDTFVPDDVFDIAPTGKWLSVGTFFTMTPERFGCLVDGFVIDKQQGLPAPAEAWGCLSWDGAARSEFFNAGSFSDAINNIIKKFGHRVWQIGDYFDMATVEDYKEYIRHGSSQKKPNE